MGLLDAFNYLEIYWGFLAIVSAVGFLSGREGSIKKNMNEKESFFHIESRFTLYYIVSLPFVLWTLYNGICAHCLGWGASERLSSLVNTLSTPHKPSTDHLSVVLCLGLFAFQLARRLHETWNISIFSKTYVPFYYKLMVWVGLLSSALCIIAEGPRFGTEGSCFSLSGLLRWNFAAGLFLFAWGTQLHHNTQQQLARLRKNKAGHIVTTAYKMPKNGWFDSISSPHYLAEIVIYIGIWLVLGFPTFGAFTYYVIYVTFRELSKARTTHLWYQQKFDDYPKDRYAAIPFLM
ncbi:unnamed protein product [Owenia fusiformis]|uniref:Polyprenal reductase n=1 Tax=Owenia fusiformis TaxID=6347 RepID=A0A8J1XRD9_OWEFU|nr:unnamed protein product [Owenia fusiformis]